jgi:hypothetical protein
MRDPIDGHATLEADAHRAQGSARHTGHALPADHATVFEQRGSHTRSIGHVDFMAVETQWDKVELWIAHVGDPGITSRI